METVKSLKGELEELDRKKNEVEERLKGIIKDIMEDEAKNNPHKPKKLGKSMFVMKFSDFIGKPWSHTFFDYEQAIEPLVDFLSKKPVSEWISELQKLIDTSSNGVINIKSTRYHNGRAYKDGFPIDTEFVSKIIDRLSDEEEEEEEGVE